MKIYPVLMDRRADGGGGGKNNLSAEGYSMCSRHNRLDLLDRGLREDWSLERLREELLHAIQSAPISGRAVGDPSAGRTREGQIQAGNRLGDMFLGSEAWKNWREDKRSGQKPDQLFHTDSLLGWRDCMGTGSDPSWGQRATLLSTGLTAYERPAGVVEIGQQPLTIAQLFAQGETGEKVVRVLQETSFTNAAAAVAEEGQKPEATFALSEVDFPVKKIAVFARTSDELLSDFPAVRDYINARLGFMVQAKEDSDLLNGGGGNAITGVLNTAGILTESAGASSLTIDAIAKALNKVRTNAFFEPDAVVMNGVDLQNILLQKDSQGRYYFGGPAEPRPLYRGWEVAATVWGLPVISTNAITQGTALVGAFKKGGQIFRRMGLTMEMTNSDGSDFQYNRTAIRVEERLALVIYRNVAFCQVTGIPAS